MQKPMRVNIKVFSREDLGRLFDLLGAKESLRNLTTASFSVGEGRAGG